MAMVGVLESTSIVYYSLAIVWSTEIPRAGLACFDYAYLYMAACFLLSPDKFQQDQKHYLWL